MTRPVHEGVWVLAEQAGGRVLGVSHELLARGRSLADKRRTALTAVLIGHNVAPADLAELIERGADRVLVMDSPALEHFLVEPHAACLSHLIREHCPEIVIAAATSTGRTLMPYVAVQVHTGLTADCTVLDIDPASGALLQTRPAIGGNIMATIRTSEHRPQMATVRPHSMRPADRTPGRKGEVLRVSPPEALPAGRMRRVGFIPNKETHPLAAADAVVAVGRGIKKADNIPLAQKLADALDAALGASRDVVDRGWLSYPHQIGLSGKTVTPRLYVGLGVSGSIQHLAGMQTAETIVAVNTDPDAQIFHVADVGIVGNLFDVVPVLVKKINAARSAT
ncbi:MAG: electron transfer flavoprotein subunit alpha/FixB family protein [Planctomycetota bacterium]|nr:electron transfer flavoprotein subunit alpha/FixB family protein [Planctomycetota bacterium]